MFRIAVLIYGQYRELDIAVRSWDFQDKFYCDFYFSLWDKTKMLSREKNENVEFYVNEQMVKNHIPNAKVSILKEVDVFEDTLYNKNLNKSLRAIYHMKNCLKMVEESRINYDNIMLTRTDQYMTSFVEYENFPSLSNENYIYGLSNIWSVHGKPFIIDTFLFGQYYTMKKFIENLPIGDDVGLHDDIPKVADELGITIKKIENFDCTIVRPNCRELKGEEINHITISQKCLEWGANI